MVTPLLIENSSRILCLGDFNIHVDQESDLRAKAFNSLLSEIGLLQHVCFPTHEKGHTLDLVLTDVRHPPLIREPGPTLQGYVQSDHYPLCFDITCPKPHKPSKIIQFRKWSNLDLEHFKSKLSSSLADSTATSDVNTMVDVYNQTLKSCLDDLLPVRSKTITEHFNCPYFNDEIRAAKQCRRKLERQWRKSRSDHHRALYVNQCKFVTTLLKRAKAEYYQTKVIECKKDQKALFRVLNELMHRNNNDGNEIANDIPCDDLAERLNHYFIEKIDHIRDHLVNTPDLTNIDHPVTVVPSSPLFSLSAFKHVTEKAVERAVQSRSSKHCPLDPIPTWLLKNSIDILAPYLTELANQSFSSGVFPYDLKTAILKPLLKKLGLDPENFKNLRPISNIAFLSKLLESLACEQYVDHLKKCNLAEMFQSAYREGHSVETALVRVHNDIMRAFDEKKSVILVLLDLSAAFDTVDHDRLLAVLNSRIGITGAALSWFESYLKGRTQHVAIKNVQSSMTKLKCGVPQGSVLGPVLFTTYLLPLGDILRKFGVQFHCYADDTQLYIPFSQNDNSCLGSIEECVSEIQIWMKANFLKLNAEKTEMIILSSPYFAKARTHDMIINLNGDLIHPNRAVRNLGVIFDNTMNMESHVNKICQTAYIHLRNI